MSTRSPKYLYHIANDGTAMRYGVAVGRQGLQKPRNLHDQPQGRMAILDANGKT